MIHVILRFLALILCLAVVQSSLAAEPKKAAPYGAPPAVAQQVDAITKSLQGSKTGEPARVIYRTDGYLRHLGTPPGGTIPVPGAKSSDARGIAEAFLAEHGTVFGLGLGNSSLTEKPRAGVT